MLSQARAYVRLISGIKIVLPRLAIIAALSAAAACASSAAAPVASLGVRATTASATSLAELYAPGHGAPAWEAQLAALRGTTFQSMINMLKTTSASVTVIDDMRIELTKDDLLQAARSLQTLAERYRTLGELWNAQGFVPSPISAEGIHEMASYVAGRTGQAKTSLALSGNDHSGGCPAGVASGANIFLQDGGISYAFCSDTTINVNSPFGHEGDHTCVHGGSTYLGPGQRYNANGNPNIGVNGVVATASCGGDGSGMLNYASGGTNMYQATTNGVPRCGSNAIVAGAGSSDASNTFGASSGLPTDGSVWGTLPGSNVSCQWLGNSL